MGKKTIVGIPMGFPTALCGASVFDMARRTQSRIPEGIEVRHKVACSLNNGGRRCSCNPGYRASVSHGARNTTQKRTFPTIGEAIAWREAQLAHFTLGTKRAAIKAPQISVLLDRLFDAMESGSIKKPGGQAYKPSAVRSYRQVSKQHLKPVFGNLRLDELSHTELQRFVDSQERRGLSGSTIRNIIMPLRVLVREALRDGIDIADPFRRLSIKAVGPGRNHVADAETVTRLIEALNVAPSKARSRELVPSETALLDRAIWATCFYAGLRLGEVQALKWGSVDMVGGFINVDKSWDERSRTLGTTKSAKGVRRLAMSANLRDEIQALKTSLDVVDSDEFMFPSRTGVPMTQQVIRRRAYRTWEAQGLERFTPHEGRHTFTSLAILSGSSPADVADSLGHKNQSFSVDQYRHAYDEERKGVASRLDRLFEESSDAQT
jgi:integrase